MRIVITHRHTGCQVKGGSVRTLVVALCIGVGALVAVDRPAAQQAAPGPADPAVVPAAVRAANARFAGVWRLVSEETRDASGRIVPGGPNGSDGGRFGYIVYDPVGYMSVNLAWRDQPPFMGPTPTPQQAATALARYNSYWGSFAVNEATGIVTHQTFGAVSPGFSGTNQERRFSFDGNRLTLRPPTAANGDQRALTWERVPDLATLTPMHRRLIGIWKLVSFERRTAKGEVRSSYPGQTGFIVYTASGHVMVHMMQPYRRRFVGPSPTPDETLATYRSYTSYFGEYTVHEREGYVVHHIASTFNSGAIGTDFQRFVELSGRRLTLRAPVTRDAAGEEIHPMIVWERLSD